MLDDVPVLGWMRQLHPVQEGGEVGRIGAERPVVVDVLRLLRRGRTRCVVEVIDHPALHAFQDVLCNAFALSCGIGRFMQRCFLVSCADLKTPWARVVAHIVVVNRLPVEDHGVADRGLQTEAVRVAPEVETEGHLRRGLLAVVQEAVRPTMFADVELQLFRQHGIEEAKDADQVRLSGTVRANHDVEALQFQFAAIDGFEPVDGQLVEQRHISSPLRTTSGGGIPLRAVAPRRTCQDSASCACR